MSEYDDYDPDEAVGIPRDLTYRTMLSEAVIKADNIHRELVGQVDGMLADYVKYALLEASDAAAKLLTMHPKNERELFELQKRASPYASVMAWIGEELHKGAQSQQQLSEQDSQEEQRRDE